MMKTATATTRMTHFQFAFRNIMIAEGRRSVDGWAIDIPEAAAVDDGFPDALALSRSLI